MTRPGESSASESPVPEPLSPARIAGLLAASAAIVAAELRALGDQAGWRFEPGEWSANECVGHLIEAERRGFAGRIRQILDAPVESPANLIAWDPPAVAAARHDELASGDALAEEFTAMRAASVEMVRALRTDDLSRYGNHPDVGPLRVDELLGEWIHHDRNHIRQLLEVTQRRVWDQMGNARRFSLENL